MTILGKNSTEAFAELERGVLAALETYSNVHRGTGHNSMVTTSLYERARDIVLNHLKLDKKKYIVIFCTPLRLESFLQSLKKNSYYTLSSREIGLPLGLRAFAVERRSLPKKIPSQKGGGIVKYVAYQTVIWSDPPERFEAGTPNIINTIAFAKALQLVEQFDKEIFKKKDVKSSTAIEILKKDGLSKYSGIELLHVLRKYHIGQDLLVPTTEGKKIYTYLDNAASTPTFLPIWNVVCKTWRQPEQVQREVIKEVKNICSKFLGAPLEKYDIIFTLNTTEAINLIAQNFNNLYNDEFKPVIVNTLLDHNSNELPWRYVSGASLVRLGVDEEGFYDLSELETLLKEYNHHHKYGKKKVILVAVSGASNVLGSFNDIQTICQIVHKYDAYILIDGAQMVAHRSISLSDIGVDFFAFSSHKVYAPFGSGALIAKKGLLNFDPKLLGNIKSSGEENVVGIAAMGKAIMILQRIGINVIKEQERTLTRKALNGFKKIPGVEIYGVKDPDSPRFSRKGGVISFSLRNIPHNLVAKLLAENGGIGVRNGCFCAHLLLKKLLKIHPLRIFGTQFLYLLFPNFASNFLPGCVRASFGIENDEKDVDHLILTLQKIARAPVSKLNKYLASTHNATAFLPHLEIQEKMENFVRDSVKNVYGSK